MTVTRITNALAEGFPWITPEYSASCSFAPLSVDPLAVALIAVDHVKVVSAKHLIKMMESMT